MKGRKIILSIAASSLLVGLFISSNKFYSAFGEVEKGKWEDIAIQPNYDLNSEVYLPNITYSVNGNNYIATPNVVFPDGVASSSHLVKMNQVGEYKVIYNASTPDGIMSKEQSFSVSCGTFTLSGEYSYASYGHDANSYKVSDVYNVDAGHDSPELDGVYVHLAEGETITFNKYIDVKNITRNDFLFSGYIVASEVGSFDFDEIDYILTDSNDPSIYVRMCTRRRTVVDEKVGYASTRVKANNQVYGAINYTQKYPNAMDIYGSSQIMPFGGKSSYLYKDAAGSEHYHPFDTINNAHPFRFSIDNSNMQMFNTVNFYTCTSKGNASGEGWDWTPRLTGKEEHIVTDLDDKEVYGNNLFTGFPSGKVQLSILCDGYNANYAQFVITSIFGTEITPDFDFKDTEAPELTVYCPYETMPEGKVNGKYPVFNATAFDEYSKDCEVKTEVIYNFQSDDAVSVAIVDNEVVTKKPGWYAIIYTASDKSGNTATKVYKFHVGGNITEMTFSDVPSEYKTKNIGEVYSVCERNVEGGSGSILITTTVKSPSGVISEYVDPFRLEELGKWTIEYQAEDMVGNVATSSYELTVNPTDNVYLEKDPTLPLSIISGGDYLIPEIKAYTYSLEGKRTSKVCKVKVFNADGSEYDTFSSGSYLTYYTDLEQTTVRIEYFSGTYDSSKVLYSEVIPAINGYNESTEEVYLGNYFIGEDISNSYSHEGVLLKSKKADSDVDTYFANPLQVLDFTTTIKTIKGATTYESLTLTFQDIEDSSLKYSLNIKFNKTNTIISNNENSETINGSFLDGSDIQINFKNSKFYFNNNNSIEVTNFDNGDTYVPFESHKAYVFITMNQAQIDSSLLVKKFNNSDFTTDESQSEFIDIIAPEMFLFGDYGGHYNLNDIYQTNIAFAADVICPNVELSLNVKNPSNKNVISGEDPSEVFDVDLLEYGGYKITYKAEDNLVNVVERKMTVYASDSESPVITMEKDMVNSASVNEAIYLPTFSATDNSSKENEIKYTVFVVYPDGHKISLGTDARYFKPSYAGVYFFRFIATDKYENSSTVEYVVNVK